MMCARGVCEADGAGWGATRRLWQHDGVALYVQLLRDAFWVNPALEAILVWCAPLLT